MGIFGSKSTSTGITTDNRVTGLENSVAASGGGSAVLREYLPTGVLDLLGEADARRSSDSLAALGMVLETTTRQMETTTAQTAAAQAQAEQALQGALLQRSSETETLANALQGITPLILGALGLLVLLVMFGGRR